MTHRADTPDEKTPPRAAHPLRTALLILAKATAIYIVLMLLWPPVAPAVAWGFRSSSNVVAAGVYRGAIQIRYEPGSIGGRDADTLVKYKDVKQRVEGATPLRMSSWYYAYTPLAMILALTVATPIPWKRRLRALAISIVIMAIIIVFGQMLVVYDALTAAQVMPIEATARTIVRTCASVIKELPGSFFIPIIVYALATFRRRELTTLFGVGEAQS